MWLQQDCANTAQIKNQQSQSPLTIRLSKKIGYYKGQADIISEYLKGQITLKIINEMAVIFRRLELRRDAPNVHTKLIERQDFL